MAGVLKEADDQIPLELLLVSEGVDPVLLGELRSLATSNRRVTVFETRLQEDVIQIPNQAFTTWAQGKGSILWTVAKNPDVTAVLQADVLNPHPALQQVIDFLHLAPAVRSYDFLHFRNIAAAILKYA
jgi:hypothetical protein